MSVFLLRMNGSGYGRLKGRNYSLLASVLLRNVTKPGNLNQQFERDVGVHLFYFNGMTVILWKFRWGTKEMMDNLMTKWALS